ncbi:hypothetical protein GW781_01050 [bacterium]|nr:hypothetical protein [bacterium]
MTVFLRCREHRAILVQVAVTAAPRCVVDWMTERALHRRVKDFILPAGRQPGYVVLDSNLAFPVVALSTTQDDISLDLSSWEKYAKELLEVSISAITYLAQPRNPGYEADRLILHVEPFRLPVFLREEDETDDIVSIEAYLAGTLKIMMDEELRRVEP